VSQPSRAVARWRVVTAVVLLHLLGLWGLQVGLLHRAVEWVVPVMAVSEAAFVSPPEPAPRPPAPSRPPSVLPRTAVQPAPAVAPDGPVAVAVNPAPLAVAPVAATSPPPSPMPARPAGPVNAAQAPSPPVALPSTQADYLNNPKPAYPALSRRLGEQGRAVVRVLIGADGLPQKAELQTSSGFERLDRAAQETVMRWRYVPGKRGDVPEAMWFNVPINFVLE
jgi:protein TonB